MLEMQRRIRQKVVGGAAVAVLLGGGAFAAVSATGQSSGQLGKHVRHGARHLHARDLAAAASYLGLSKSALASELGSGKSLAQIAAAQGAGKSSAGLVEAIVTERKARLAKAAANLPTRIGVEVARPGGPGSPAARSHDAASALVLFVAPRHLGATAAGYLDIPLAQLHSELQAGRTLADVAAATPGKSKAGLVAALVAAKQQRIAARAAGEGPGSQARGERREAQLQKRVGRLVERSFVPAATS
jgi:hypothetical protein